MEKSLQPRRISTDTSLISSRYPVQLPRLVKKAMSIMIFRAETNSSPYRPPPTSTDIASHPGHQYRKSSAALCLGLFCQNPANVCCGSSSVSIRSSWPLAAWKLAGGQLVTVQTSSSRWKKKSLSVREHAFACSKIYRTPCTVATSASKYFCAGLNINPLKIVTSSLHDAWTAASTRSGLRCGNTCFDLDGTKGSTTDGGSGLGERCMQGVSVGSPVPLRHGGVLALFSFLFALSCELPDGFSIGFRLSLFTVSWAPACDVFCSTSTGTREARQKSFLSVHS